MRCLNVKRAKYTSERFNVYGYDAAFSHTSVFVIHRTIAWSKQHKWSYVHRLFSTCLCLWSCNKLIYIELHSCSFSPTAISLSAQLGSVQLMCFEYKHYSGNHFQSNNVMDIFISLSSLGIFCWNTETNRCRPFAATVIEQSNTHNIQFENTFSHRHNHKVNQTASHLDSVCVRFYICFVIL